MKSTIIFFLFFFCIEVFTFGQSRGQTALPESSFFVTIVNNTRFAISVFPRDNELITSGSSRRIQLPVQRNQLSEGYQITCYVNIADDVIKAIPLERKIIAIDEHTVIVDNNNFVLNESFFVITNVTNNTTVRVRQTHSTTYRSGLGTQAEIIGTRINLTPGRTQVYDTDDLSWSLENEQGVLFAIPPTIQRRGYVSYFIFDGLNVSPIDVRPLNEIGMPTPINVEFTGANISKTEQQNLRRSLSTALERFQIPLYLVTEENAERLNGRVFYSLRIDLQIDERDHRTYGMTHVGGVSLSLLRNGIELGHIRPVRGNITVRGSQDAFLERASNYIMGIETFYQAIKLFFL